MELYCLTISSKKSLAIMKSASIFRVVLTITLIVKDGQLLDECNVLEIQTLFSVLCLLPRFDVDHCQHLGTALFLFQVLQAAML